MSALFEASKKTVVLKDGKFSECVFVLINYGRQASIVPGGATFTLDGEEFTKHFEAATPDSFHFLVLDLNAKSAVEQVIGCASFEPFYEEPTPGKIYFFA